MRGIGSLYVIQTLNLSVTPLKRKVATLVEDQPIRELLFPLMDQPILLKKDGMDVSPKKGIPIIPSGGKHGQ